MIAALVLAVTFPFLNHAATLKAAALGAFFPRAGVTVVRENVAGRYATVLTNGGKMEGSAVVAPILVEHFSFGWQALTLVQGGCDLLGVSWDQQVELLRGMPPIVRTRGKCVDPVDSGPMADVEAVRVRMRGPLIPYVVVREAYAIGEWYGGGGGQTIYHKRNGSWIQVAYGGGPMSATTMLGLGVPQKDLCAFGVSDACTVHYK